MLSDLKCILWLASCFCWVTRNMSTAYISKKSIDSCVTSIYSFCHCPYDHQFLDGTKIPQPRVDYAEASVKTSIEYCCACCLSSIGNQPLKLDRKVVQSSKLPLMSSVIGMILAGCFPAAAVYRLWIKGLPKGNTLVMKFNLPANDCKTIAGAIVVPSVCLKCASRSLVLSWGTLIIISRVSISKLRNSMICVALTCLSWAIGTPTSSQVLWMVSMMKSHTCCRICAVKKSSK